MSRHGLASARFPVRVGIRRLLRLPYRRGTRRPLPQGEHRLGDLAGRRIGDRGGRFLEDEQPCPGDLARDGLAVADGEERVPAAVDDERGDLDLGQALAPAGSQLSLAKTMPSWLAIWTGGVVPGVRSQMHAAVARAAAGSSPRISARAAADSATASRSVQSGTGRVNGCFIVALSWPGRSASDLPGATARVPARVSAERQAEVVLADARHIPRRRPSLALHRSR